MIKYIYHNTNNKRMEAQNNYEFEKYICTKETLKNTIDQYGVAIIPNILDENECSIMVNQIWDFFEHITQKWEIPINRNNENTFILAGSIQVGDVLSKHDAQGNIYSEEITSLDVITEECTVHTFNAEPYDLIYANGILTHNK